MDSEQREYAPRQEWRNETEQLGGSIKNFLRDYSNRKIEERPRYDPFVELHFSGHGDGLDNIESEAVAPMRVDVFYEGGKPTQIHAVFQSERGHNIDVYLKGKALEDYLASENKAEQEER